MSNPILLIIQREFLSRVRKKTFLLVTLIGPLAFAALMVVPALFASASEDTKQIIVLDEPSILLPHEGKEQYVLEYLDPRENDLELAKELLRDSQYDALLYIPSGENWDPDFIKNNILLFGQEDPSLEMQGYLDYLLEEQINKAKLLKNGVDPEVVAQIKTNVTIKSFTLGEEGTDEQSAVPIKMALGYITGLLVYIFIFFYSVQVMRGVMEEKNSRIVEVIISSVRPYQLMMGKILGVGLVGVAQFIIWIGLSGILYTVISTYLFPELFAAQSAADAAGNPAADAVGLKVLDMLRSIDFTTVTLGFAFLLFRWVFPLQCLIRCCGQCGRSGSRHPTIHVTRHHTYDSCVCYRAERYPRTERHVRFLDEYDSIDLAHYYDGSAPVWDSALGGIFKWWYISRYIFHCCWTGR
jgi:ABC-2 type transport system permease protein